MASNARKPDREQYLTYDDRSLLARWLPVRGRTLSQFTDLRSLNTELSLEGVTPAVVRERLAQLRALIEELQGEASTLDHYAPIGRGEARREGSYHFTDLSPWELAWLHVDRLLDLDHPETLRAGLDRLRGSSRVDADGLWVEALGMAVLCQPTREAAERLVTLAADHVALPDELPDGPWVQWLAGRGPVPPSALCARTEGLGEALAGDLRGAEQRLPATYRGHSRALRPAVPATMQRQLLGQILSFATQNKPRATTVRQSLRTFFHEWGYARGVPWWCGTNVSQKLPFLALYQHHVEPTASPVSLLHTMRNENEHLLTPVARTFRAPARVIDAMRSMVRWLEAATETGL